MEKVIDFNAYVEKSNNKFKKATAAEKRVMIAKDTILRIESGNINVQRGSLLSARGFIETSFKDYINKPNDCMVCAKGALFCSLVGRVNKFDQNDYMKSANHAEDSVHGKLLKYFSLKQLDLIEIALEKTSYLDAEKARVSFNKAYYFGEGGSKQIVLAICKNIIKNKGTFRP